MTTELVPLADDSKPVSSGFKYVISRLRPAPSLLFGQFSHEAYLNAANQQAKQQQPSGA